MDACEPTREDNEQPDDQRRRATLAQHQARAEARAEVRAWLDDECKTFEQAWLKRWNARHSDLPTRLYHYTTAEGVRGILESQTLWATDPRYLNDTTELSHANAIIAKVAAELLVEYGSGIQQTYLNAASLDLLDVFNKMFGTYVVCFCTESDLLSQWRAYAASRPGYAVGFDSHALQRSGSVQRLRPVTYDEADQKSLVREALAFYADGLERFDHGSHVRDFAVTAALDDTAQVLFECVFCFKHPGFAEEKEWRLVHTPLQDQHTPLFRTGRAGLIPYVELRPYGAAPSGGKTLPIVRRSVRSTPASCVGAKRSASAS